MIAAAFRAVALAATLALPASWPLALPASEGHVAAGQVTAPIPPASGHFSAITVRGGTGAQAEGINDSGVIVGCYGAKTGERAFVDRHGKISTFADPAAGRHGFTCAFGINDAGVIVGYYQPSGGVFRAFVDRNGRFTSITAPGAGTRDGRTVADGINRAGTIVGDYFTGKPSSKQTGFVLSKGKFSTVKVPLSAHSHPTASAITGIADDGTISGVVVVGGRSHGFIERAGKFTAVNVPHAFGTEAACVSEHGRLVVGGYQPTRASNTSIGFTFRSGVYHSLRDPAAPRHTFPECANALGFVVGFLENSRDVITQAFVFTPARRAG